MINPKLSPWRAANRTIRLIVGTKNYTSWENTQTTNHKGFLKMECNQANIRRCNWLPWWSNDHCLLIALALILTKKFACTTNEHIWSKFSQWLSIFYNNKKVLGIFIWNKVRRCWSVDQLLLDWPLFGQVLYQSKLSPI